MCQVQFCGFLNENNLRANNKIFDWIKIFYLGLENLFKNFVFMVNATKSKCKNVMFLLDFLM